MIIDAHNHPDWHGHDLRRFLANMDAQGIDVTWLLSWECPPDEYDPQYIPVISDIGESGPVPFARCLSYVERCPDRFVLGFCPDPRRPDAIDRLKAMKEIYGVRVCGELKVRMTYDNPDALRMFRWCGTARLPVTIHLDYPFPTGHDYPRPDWWYGGGIAALERAVAACPDTIFIGHAPGFWAHISGDDQYAKEPYPKGPLVPGGEVARMLRAYPNLHADISAGSGWNALNRDHDFTKEFLGEFQDRILFGRDYFDSRHRELLDSLDIPVAVKEKIYSGNALRLVPIPGGGS
jgi:predicted TIM-barrel fold metal-dependent hydrolase